MDKMFNKNQLSVLKKVMGPNWRKTIKTDPSSNKSIKTKIKKMNGKQRR